MNMNRSNNRTTLAAAVVAVMSSAAAAQVHPEKPTYPFEKCYGVSRAGMNDCFTQSNTCAGTAAQDNLSDIWIYVPRGTCRKITGGRSDAPTQPR